MEAHRTTLASLGLIVTLLGVGCSDDAGDDQPVVDDTGADTLGSDTGEDTLVAETDVDSGEADTAEMVDSTTAETAVDSATTDTATSTDRHRSRQRHHRDRRRQRHGQRERLGGRRRLADSAADGSADSAADGSSEASTPTAWKHTITIDGTNDFTSDEIFTTTSDASGYDAYMTWDATKFYVGYKGPDIAAGGSHFVFGVLRHRNRRHDVERAIFDTAADAPFRGGRLPRLEGRLHLRRVQDLVWNGVDDDARHPRDWAHQRLRRDRRPALRAHGHRAACDVVLDQRDRGRRVHLRRSLHRQLHRRVFRGRDAAVDHEVRRREPLGRARSERSFAREALISQALSSSSSSSSEISSCSGPRSPAA